MEIREKQAVMAAGLSGLVDYLAHGAMFHAVSVGVMVYSGAMLYQLHLPSIQEWYKSKMSRNNR